MRRSGSSENQTRPADQSDEGKNFDFVCESKTSLLPPSLVELSTAIVAESIGLPRESRSLYQARAEQIKIVA